MLFRACPPQLQPRRAIRGCFLWLTLFAVSSAGAAEIDFVRIWPAWRDADSFLRISEYFGGSENTGRQTVLRTRLGERSGFYFLARLDNDGPAPASARFELKFILPDSPYPRTHLFATVLPTGRHTFNLGLTGEDWPDKKTQPVAWQLRLLDTSGGELAVKKSFLWEKPDGE
jgi:hypothetical protein